MKRGNERVQMLRSGIGMPGERIVDPIAGRKNCACYPQMSLFSEEVDSEGCTQENTGSELTAETDAHVSERLETPTTGKVTRGSVGVLAKWKVPRLTNTKVRAEGRVPRILVLRSRSAGIVEEPEPVQPLSFAPPLAVVEEQERPAPAAPLPAKVVVTVVPTPRKARVRTPKVDEPSIPPAPVEKPLKVIRRRREETPKVFKTTAKSFPRAMLEGIDIESGENNHGQID